ncbi:MAG: GFA family protein, partial [Pseudomonadales bacterium]|nr:GFA family protein [Pseudomonadales bacterium]
MIEGGCFCGKIRYTIDPGEYPIVNCHCSMCRKISGAPFVTWIVVPRESLKYLQGSPRALNSSAKGRRQFCSDCGTPLSFHATDRLTDIDVTTCSLDDPDSYIPTRAGHEELKLKWLHRTE